MKTIEVGKEYFDGLGRRIRVIHKNGPGENGVSYYLGVVTEIRGAAFSTHVYTEDGVSAYAPGGYTDLDIFDWRDLQQDDVIELSRGIYTVRRYVCRVEDDALVVYGDGVSSLTFDGGIQEAVRCRPTEFVRVIKKNPDHTQ